MTNAIAEKLVSAMRRPVRPALMKLRNFVQGRPASRRLRAEVKSIESLVAGGSDPVHAAYTVAQNYLSVFGELASALSEFEDFATVVADAEDNYMPGWPPMSPVSVSFFTCWAFLDLPVSATGETICSCAVEIGRSVGMPDEFVATLETMGRSAMGIYEHMGWQNMGKHGDLVQLRDILDDQVHHCIVPSGHRGEDGELWYVRLLPPLHDASAYDVAFTSPYVLRGATEADWLAFFKRQQQALPRSGPMAGSVPDRKALLKRGPDPNYWNEFVFLAYSNASANAIVLYGIPDRPRTLPHGHQRRRGDSQIFGVLG